MMRKHAFLPLLLAPSLFALCVPVAASPSDDLLLVNRLSWGETAQGDTLGGQSAQAWLEQQLHPTADDGLPPEVQARIAAMDISQHSPARLNDQVLVLRQEMQHAGSGPDGDAARKAYQQRLTERARQAQERSLLRDLYSRNQLKEQLPWFWFNHFNVDARKGEIRAFVG